jgi:hypothetical protein
MNDVQDQDNKQTCDSRRITIAFDQYHQPPEELSHETRTPARVTLSLIEEVEAIDCYEQRAPVEQDEDASAIMAHAQIEEMIHFSIESAFLLRKKLRWETALKIILFKDGDLTELAENAEKESPEH